MRRVRWKSNSGERVVEVRWLATADRTFLMFAEDALLRMAEGIWTDAGDELLSQSAARAS
ncbi:MAG: hypothetical protein JNG88_11325 [Phycisphaerales bacterium]|nr:hypothetical protein [Phycisphaerales bacterium]